MKRRIRKAFNDLPLSLKISCGFLSVCCALTAASGIVYYRHSKKAVEDSIREQACDLRERIEREFTLYYAAPIAHELHILVTSPQLNNYLMSSKEEMLIHRAQVEQLFLSLSQGRDLYRSTKFLDASGQETIGTCDNTRQRSFRSFAQRADDGLPGRNLNRVFTALQAENAPPLSYSAPFRDAQNKLGILVGVAKQEPEAGGFGGAVVQHCDLTGFVHDVSQNRIRGAAVVWVYDSEGKTLSAPPEGEIQQDPRPRRAGAEVSSDGCAYTARCRFLADDSPVMTVVCSVPPEIISRELAPVIRSVVVIFSVLLAGSLASSFLISRWISGRIRKLTNAAQNVSARRLDIDLDAGLTESTDEIGILAHAFQTMILGLKDSTTSIDNLNLEITQRQQVQEALGRERDRAQQYLDVADVLLLALNEKGQITLINREGSRLLGYEEGELLGKDWIETCLPSPVRQDAQEVFRTLMAGQIDPVKYVENPVRTRSGAERILAWHNTILRDDTGRIVGTLSSGEDITERRQMEEALRESEERLRRTLDAAQTVAWEGNLQSGALIETGPVAALFGQPEGAVCTDQFAFLERIHPEDRERVLATMQPGAAGEGAYEVEFRVPLPNGEIRWIQATGGFDRDADGQPIRLRGIARDITAQKRAEGQQTILLQQLDGINQELKEFAYVVSHDLKAPLRAIRNLADWLCADYQDKLDDQGRENLRLLSGRVNRMHNLIDGVLQYSRIGRTEQRTAPIDLNRLVPEIIDGLGVPEHIAIHVEPDLPTVEADATRITQVFQNLLSNALKYMDKPQGRITVACVPDDGFWKFSVADNGPGIERKDYERVFKLFQTLTCRDDSESTGVGLTVTKKIVEMYGGRIWVESEVGKGSTFFFTFPRSKEAVVPECLAAGVAS